MLKTSDKQRAASGAKPATKATARKQSSKPQAKEWADEAALEIASALSGREVSQIPLLASNSPAQK